MFHILKINQQENLNSLSKAFKNLYQNDFTEKLLWFTFWNKSS